MIIIEKEDPILETIWKFSLALKSFTVDQVVEDSKQPRSTVVHRMLKYQNKGILKDDGTTENKNVAGWNAKPKNLYSLNQVEFEKQIGKVVE